jgi:hypothetical protein
MSRRAAVTLPDIEGGTSAIDMYGHGDIEYTGPVKFLSPGEAQRLTQHIKLTASGVRNGLFKLRNLIDEAKRSNVWQVLGFPSWTAYLSDALAEEPMRVPREERLEIVAWLSGEGLSTRAIAPIVGVDRKTVERDIRGGTNVPPDSPVEESTAVGPAAPGEPAAVTAPPVPTAAGTINLATGEITEPAVIEHTVTEKTRTVTGLDGKSYEVKAKPAPDVDRVNAETESKALGRALMTLTGMKHPAHRNRIITDWWPAGNDAVPPDSRALFEPKAIRDIATWLLQLADELEGTS